MKESEKHKARWGSWSDDPDAMKPSDSELKAIRDRFASGELSVDSIVTAERSLDMLDHKYERLTKYKKLVMWISGFIAGSILDQMALAFGWIRPEMLPSYYVKQLWNYIF